MQSNVLASSSVGFLPLSMYRKFAARFSLGFGVISGLPRRMRGHVTGRAADEAAKRDEAQGQREYVPPQRGRGG